MIKYLTHAICVFLLVLSTVFMAAAMFPEEAYAALTKKEQVVFPKVDPKEIPSPTSSILN